MRTRDIGALIGSGFFLTPGTVRQKSLCTMRFGVRGRRRFSRANAGPLCGGGGDAGVGDGDWIWGYSGLGRRWLGGFW
jgi:hypothetical protein